MEELRFEMLEEIKDWAVEEEIDAANTAAVNELIEEMESRWVYRYGKRSSKLIESVIEEFKEWLILDVA